MRTPYVHALIDRPLRSDEASETPVDQRTRSTRLQVTFMTTVQDIDLRDPQLTPSELSMLTDLMKARDQYCNQGRGREYHALGKALMIVWHYTRRAGGQPDLPRTDFGSLDVPLPLDGSREATARERALAWGFSEALRRQSVAPTPA